MKSLQSVKTHIRVSNLISTPSIKHTDTVNYIDLKVIVGKRWDKGKNA